MPTRARRDPLAGPDWTLLVLLAAAFATKTAVMLQLRANPLLAPDAGLDTTAYVQLASKVLAGDLWLGPGLYYVSPLYIYVLAGGLAAFHSFTAVRFAQIALGTAGVGAIFVMTREWFGRRAGLFAAATAALTGLFTFYEILILQASIDVFLTAVALCALAIGLKRRNARSIAVAGVVFGVQTLNRPNVLLAALAVGAVLLCVRRMRPAVALMLGLALGLSPALVRNVLVARQWSAVSSHGGLNFYIGNSATATGFYHAIPGITPTIGGQQTDARRVAEHAAGRPLDDAEVSGYFYALGRSWIQAHPAAAVTLFVRKLGYVFDAAHVALPHSYPFYAYDERTLLRFLFVGPWLLIPIGIVGLLLPLFRERDPAYMAWAAFLPAYAAAVAVFFVAERYRLPMLVPLAAGAGAAIDHTVALAKRGRYGQLSRAALPAALVFAFVNWPLGLDDGRWQEGLRMAQRLVIVGRYSDAAAWANRIEPREPSPGATQLGLGAQLIVEGQFDRAVPHLQRAIDRGCTDPSADYQLGEALLESGRAAAAVPHLRRAAAAGAGGPREGLTYAKALLTVGDDAGAVGALAQVPLPENNAEVWAAAGRIAAGAHAPEEAERFFARAAAIHPDDAAVRQQHGLNLLVLDRLSDAAGELSAAARLDPRDPDTLSRLAYCEQRLGRTADARAHAAAALALNPGDRLARELLRSLAQNGDTHSSALRRN